MDYSFCRCTDHLGIQNTDNHCIVHGRSRVYRPVHQPKGGHLTDGYAQGGRRTRGKDRQLAPKDPLHSFRRQQWRFGTG